MSEKLSPTNSLYNEFISTFQGYVDTFDSLYKLKTQDEKELDTIYKDMKMKLIDSLKYPVNQLIHDLSHITSTYDRYMKSYLYLVKKLVDEFQIKKVSDIYDYFNYKFYKEYGILLNGSNIDELASEFEDSVIYNENPVFNAIIDDDKASLITCIERGTYDEYKKIFGFDPFLEVCCTYGSVDCFKYLRTVFHTDIIIQNLCFSFIGGNYEIISECLKAQNPDKQCMTNAIISHNIDFVTFLYNEFKIEIDLNDCMMFNNLQAFLIYLDQTNDIDSCFAYSPRFYIPSLCEYFISHGANINGRDELGRTALHHAAEINNIEILDFLISHGADIKAEDKTGKTPFYYALSKCNIETLENLISHGADINAKDHDGNTLLHKVNALSAEIAEFLISHGADINAKDNLGRAPLHVAAIYDCPEIIEILISHGADIEAKDLENTTPLHQAASSDSPEATEILISHGADINARDSFEGTPLHHAASNNCIEPLEILVEHGADINAKDMYKETALDKANNAGYDDIIEILDSH